MSIGIISGLSSQANAFDFIAGAKGGYFIWDPYLEEIMSDQFKGMNNGDGVLYGPVFSAMFTHDLSLSVSGLFGKQSSHWKSEGFHRTGDPDKSITGSFSFNTKRYDIDSALNYSIVEHFKVFAGYKYQYLNTKMESITFSVNDGTGVLNDVEVQTFKIKIPNHGPVIGAGFSTFLGERFFFASNLSVLYMFGEMDFSQDGYQYNSSSGWVKKQSNGGEMNGIKMRTRGINFESAIGASMGEGLPIFTLGLRFQWTQIHFIDPPAQSVITKITKDWSNDYLYGVVISVLYPF